MGRSGGRKGAQASRIAKQVVLPRRTNMAKVVLLKRTTCPEEGAASAGRTQAFWAVALFFVLARAARGPRIGTKRISIRWPRAALMR